MIIGYICEDSEERISFEDCMECAAETGHPCDFTPEILRGIFDGIRIPGENFSATNLLACPRKVRLMREHDYYIRPSNAYWAFRGQLTHRLVEKETGEGVMAEKKFEATIPIDGKEIVIIGSPDYFHSATGILRDYKTCEAVPKYRRPYGEHALQANIYASLLRANGYAVSAAEIIYLSMKRIKRLPVELMPEENCGKMIELRLRALLAPELPRRLEPDSREAWQCDGYCDVKAICEKLAMEELRGEIRKEIRKEMGEEKS